ncbi:hypothetical protein P5P86_12255 [Nocardioides sp. BP30]|uniref:hypothetical protein n=1 Tax=Nocardioides sp. BP30 TaxID=3036374 RepID=UPI002468452A|nr:hypothetical protein [Nocardioides sp. BP30]WGL50736.1 hypothetical protein P5P86_12255 [Nocardioides sp. BP30]
MVAELEQGHDVTVRPPAIRLISYSGLSFLAILLLSSIAAKNDVAISVGDLWLLISILIFPSAFFLWLMGSYTALKLSNPGIVIVNPFTEANIPWHEVVSISEDTNGRMRFETATISASSWAVGASNWESWLKRPDRVHRFSEILTKYIDPETSSASSDFSAWIKWRLPRSAVICFSIAWAVASAALFLT